MSCLAKELDNGGFGEIIKMSWVDKKEYMKKIIG